MALVTAQQFIYQALRKIGQLRPGYLSQPELLADALNEWSLYFDELNAERTANYSNPDYTFAVTGPGSRTNGNGYAIGPVLTFSGTTVIGSPTVAALNTLGLAIGMPVTGTGIPAGTTILGVSPNVSIHLSANATANGTVTLTVTPDFIAPRPEAIIRANNVQTNQGPQPVYIQLRPISQEEWAGLSIQQIPGINITSVFWYDPQFPQGVFNVFPPLNGNSIQIYTWGVLVPPLSLSSSYSAPPGYGDMVVYGLAERLYFMCTAALTKRVVPYQVIAGKAKAARDKIRRVNRPIPRLGTDFPHSDGPDGYYDSFVYQSGNPQ